MERLVSLIALSQLALLTGNLQAETECRRLDADSGSFYQEMNSDYLYRTRQDCASDQRRIGVLREDGAGYVAQCVRYGTASRESIRSALEWIQGSCPDAKTVRLDVSQEALFFRTIDEQLEEVEYQIGRAASVREFGVLTKKKAELVFEKSRVDAEYLVEAVTVMNEASRIFQRNGDVILEAQALTALGNINNHLNRPRAAYDLYAKAARMVENLDFRAFFEAELNRCSLCCKRLKDGGVDFAFKAALEPEGPETVDACCFQIPKGLAVRAREENEIEMEFAAYNNMIGLVEYREDREIKDEVKDHFADLAVRLLTERPSSSYRQLAAESLVSRSRELLSTSSVEGAGKSIGWLDGTLEAINSLEKPDLSYWAAVSLGMARVRLGRDLEDGIENLKTALLLGSALRKDPGVLIGIFEYAIEGLTHLARYDEALEVADMAKEFSAEWGESPAATHMLVGNLLDLRGDYADALDQYRAAIRSLARQSDDRLRPQILYNMAFVYRNIGEYDEARAKLVESLSGHAEILESMVGYREAQPIPAVDENSEYYMGKDMEFTERFAAAGVDPARDYYLGRLLNNIWNCYTQMAEVDVEEGDAEAARANYLRAAKWYQRATARYYYGGDSVYGDPGTTLGLSRLATRAGDRALAWKYLKYYDSQDNGTSSFNLPEHKAERLFIQGKLEYADGELDRSKSTLAAALKLSEEAGLAVRRALVLSQLAFVVAADRDFEAAYEYFVAALKAENELLESVLYSGSERAKLDFLDANRETFDGFMTLFRRAFREDQEKVEEAFLMVQIRKAAVFEAQTRLLQAVAHSLDDEAHELVKRLTRVRSEIAQLLLGRRTLSPAAVESRVDDLSKESRELELELAAHSRRLATRFRPTLPSSSNLASALRSGAALVEYIAISDYDFIRREARQDRNLMVFTLDAEGRTVCLDLGDSRQIEKQVLEAVRSIREAAGDYVRGVRGAVVIGKKGEDQERLLESLYNTIWRPVEKSLGRRDLTHYWIAPDDFLNRLPFAALKKSHHSFLIEDSEMVYLNSGKDLLNSGGSKPELDLLAVADPNFDLSVGVEGMVGRRARGRVSLSSESLSRLGPLPGSGREARAVSDLFGEAKSLLLGDRATEAAVRSAASVRVLHIATHGFFLEPASGKAPEDGTQGSGLFAGDPLLRSGLALAGARHASDRPSEDDGLFTAFEVMGMDLHGTELVTLSGCETGLGDMRSGEGVLGLRRAFALAGAKNIMMSLWPIGDAWTAEQMVRFYRRYQGGETPAQALRQMQLAVMNDLRQERGYAPVHLWAAFIVLEARQ